MHVKTTFRGFIVLVVLVGAIGGATSDQCGDDTFGGFDAVALEDPLLQTHENGTAANGTKSTKFSSAALVTDIGKQLTNRHPISPFLALGRERGSLAATLPKGGESGGFTPCHASANAPSPLLTYLQEKRINWYNEFELIDYMHQRRIDRVIEWARSQLGDKSYHGYCQRFVRLAFEHGGFRYDGDAYIGSAKDAFREFGVVSWETTPTNSEKLLIPVGATIYFDTGRWGHVGIVTEVVSDQCGNAIVTMIHGVDRVEEIVVSENWWAKAIGWGHQGRTH